MQVTWIFNALALIILTLGTSTCLAQDKYCPQSISVDQKIENAPSGWAASDDHSASSLAALTFFSGPPSEDASLKYDRWTVRNGLAYATWKFEPDSPGGIWLTCRYSSTRVVLTKKLPQNISECTVTYDPKVQVSGSPEIRKIACH